MPAYQHVDIGAGEALDTPVTRAARASAEALPPTPPELNELLRAVQLTLRRALDERLNWLAMTCVQWHALRTISRNPGLPQRQLARLTAHSDQAFNALVGRLLDRQLIAPQRGFGGKAVAHELTAGGRILLRAADDVTDDALNILFGLLPDAERKALRSALKRILDGRVLLAREPLPDPPW